MNAKLEMVEDVLCLFAAALAQETISLPASWPVKFCALTAVALRMSMRRPIAEGMVCALWAGVLTDALSGLPLFCTALYLLLLYGLTRFLQSVFLTPTFLHGVLLCGLAAMGQVLWTKVWMGSEQPLTFVQTLARCGQAFPVGIAAGMAGFLGCGLVDRLSGRSRPAEEGNGIIWPETNR